MNLNKLILVICLTFIVGCGSVRHNQSLEITEWEVKWRKTQYKWLKCISEKGNLRVNAGVKQDSLQQEIWNRDGRIDSLNLELRNINYKFTKRKKCW